MVVPASFAATLAEREGFEPSFPCGKRALQARALDHATRPLQIPDKFACRAGKIIP
jgi:hypothetical protein